MRVLIVGCGYVGLPLAAELARRGHAVSGLSRSAGDAIRAAGATPLAADITRPETLVTLPREFDWVVNCAATGGGSVEDYRTLYLEGTRNLINWLAPANDATRFVYTSSTGVYGQNDGSLVDESSATEPASETAKILVATEQSLLSFARERKFPAMILRAAGIYGPGRGYLLKQLLRTEARIDGDGARILNMIHRDDLITAIIAALEHGQGGEIYNACDDEPVSQLDFFSWACKELNRPLPPRNDETSAAPRKRGLTNKRISNRKLRERLNVALKFPDFRTGYRPEVDAVVRESRRQS